MTSSASRREAGRLRGGVRRIACRAVLLGVVLLSPAHAKDCDGAPLPGIAGLPKTLKLADGTIAGFSRMNINIDGYGHAYHPANADGGALLHLCNAGRVRLPDGTQYEGSESNATCTGRFMNDFKRIGQAGWTDPTVGVVQWYGILGKGSATIRSVKIDGVVPVANRDGSGFYVSPTSLFDRSVTDVDDQARYVNPLRIASAVVPRSLVGAGIAMGSFGVAYDVNRRIPVPFVVGDGGPRVGEGSVALARRVAGQPATDAVTRGNRYVGQVDKPDVLWVFFGGPPAAYDHADEGALTKGADAAFDAWGGKERLAACATSVPR